MLTTRALAGGTSELIVDWLLASDPVPLEVLTGVLSNLYLAVIHYRRSVCARPGRFIAP